MPECIPYEWRRAVVAILQEGLHSKRIEVSRRAFVDYQSLFPSEFSYQMFEAFADALSLPEVFGKREYGMVPEGETYGFIFKHQRKEVYGKVCLTADGRVVVIFSAHRPLKGESV